MISVRAATIALGVVLFADVACSAKLSLEGRGCPCTAGYVCCEASERCIVEDEDFDQTTCGTKAAKTGKTGSTGSTDLPTPSARAGVEIAKASSPMCFATDDEAVYWMNRDGTIGAVRTADGPPIVIQRFLVPAAPVTACGMARAGGHLFVTLETATSVLRLSVRADASGGLSLGDSADRIGTFEEPIALAASDDRTLFVAEKKTLRIKQLDVATATLTEVTTSAQPVKELLVTNGALVWSGGGVVTRSTAPGSSLVYLANESDAKQLVLRDGRVFFLADNGNLWSAPLSGESAARRETGLHDDDDTPNSGLGNLAAFAFDGSKVVAVRSESFYEATFDGKRPRALFRVQTSQADAPRFLTVDAKRYLWATSAGIWSASRPIATDE